MGVWVALCADLSPLQPVKTRIPGGGRPCFLFSLVPPPNLSETFENKILFVPPHHNAAVDCRRAVPYGAQGGEGVAEGGEGLPARGRRSFREQFAGGLPFSGRFHPSLDPEPEDWGAGCGDGGGGPSRGLPAYFPEAPRAEGEGRRVGGRGRGGRVWRRGQLGARSKAGRTGSLNFAECVLGEGSAPRRTGSDFSRFAPSPPSLPAHTPAPCLEAGWGAGEGGGGTFCPFGEEGEKAS